MTSDEKTRNYGVIATSYTRFVLAGCLTGQEKSHMLMLILVTMVTE